MPLDLALAALRAGRPALIRDDRDAHGAAAWVVAAGADPLIAAESLGCADGVVTLARESARAPDAWPISDAWRVALIRPGGALAVRSLEAGAHDLVRLATGENAALLVAAPDQAAAQDPASVTLTEIAAHRERTEILVEAAAVARLPSAHGVAGFTAHAFVSLYDGVEHLALVKGDPAPGALVRVHSECLTGDALGSLRCDCGEQLRAAMARIAAADCGALIYLRGHEGRGIGLANKIRAYALQDGGLDTAEANAALGFPEDSREYAVAAQMLKRLGLFDVRLLSNNPRKGRALESFGITVREEVSLLIAANPHNLAYLGAKRDKLGHRIPRTQDVRLRVSQA
jgi:3,4-dihydroxy 2-butanone 4-phosphate synthase/GTP cyclohydrolase II